MTFDSLGLAPAYLRAVADEGYTEPTPVQAKAIPIVLAGRDLLAGAQTGTGKTAAFVLPMLQRLHDSDPGAGVAHGTHSARPGGGRATRPTPPVRALVLAPTRELALQVEESVRTYGRHRPMTSVAIYGGVGFNPQVASLRRGAPIVVATPGRLLDHVSQGTIDLSRVEILVLDEADRMLDMGFIHDIRRVASHVPRKRQTLFFSATLPEDIRTLAADLLNDPIRVAVDPPASTVELIEQAVCFVEKGDKLGLLQHLLSVPELRRVLVFARTKHGSDKVVKLLKREGVGAQAIHGNKSQGARTRALDGFKTGGTRILVATDIAARGLDVEDIDLVVNFDLPHEPEVYVHRIGRTGRAGDRGTAISFCAEEEREDLAAIERLIGMHLVRVSEHPFRSPVPPPPVTVLKGRERPRGQGSPQQPPPQRGSAPGRGHRRGPRRADGTSAARR